MKHWILAIITGLFMSIAFVAGLHSGLKQTDTKLVTECPAQQVVEEVVTQNVIELDGWKCDAPREGQSDLLQPSGVWWLDFVTCYKLETPIWEWCAAHPNASCTEEQKKRP